jgi:hypothetical protein
MSHLGIVTYELQNLIIHPYSHTSLVIGGSSKDKVRPLKVFGGSRVDTKADIHLRYRDFFQLLVRRNS